MPGSFIIDLRNANKKRIENIDTNKISIQMKNDHYLKYINNSGTEKGLFTIFLLADPGEYEFAILYNNIQILENTYTFYWACSFNKISKFKKNISLIKGIYYFYKVIDSSLNERNFQYKWNDLNIKEYANYLFSASE